MTIVGKVQIIFIVYLSVILTQIKAFLVVIQPSAVGEATWLSTTALNTQPINDIFDEQRRHFLELTLSSPLLLATTARNEDPVVPTASEVVTVPLRFIRTLNAYVVYFGLYDETPEKFTAILDTGSPFLTVASYCNPSRWGCYRPELTTDSGYSNTIERFDNNEGVVVWRKSRFSFLNASGSLMGPRDVVFGVLDEKLMDGSGGVFFGLIKKTEKRIRPSFLGQLGVKAFQIDLKSDEKALTLSTQPMITGLGYIPLVSDLNTRYKDPVGHYTAIADAIRVNGTPLKPTKFRNKPTYVIFDTGVTGMVVSQELFDERYTVARSNREKSLWGSVEISFRTKEGKTVSLTATKPITTPLGQKPWPGFNANLIVMGLAFLDDHTMTVDVDDQKLQID